jgi:uncharacterized membrane protein YdjX (TVP38/TMEM64 family)
MKPNHSSRYQKLFQVALVLGAIAIFFLTPLRDLLNQEVLTAYLSPLGIWAVPLFVSTYVLVTVLGLPITIHTLTGGVVFGLFWGTVWSTIAATLGAMAAFVCTRYLLKNWATAKFGHHRLLQRWQQAIAQHPFQLVLSLRFAPIAPFNLVNLLLAITSIDLRTYSLATGLGVIPGTIAYTWLGAAGQTAFQTKDYWQFICASLLLVLLSLLPLWWQQRSAKKTTTR